MDSYLSIVRHYEKCLEKYGDSCKGVDWPNEKDALKRYEVMLDVVREDYANILDFGCGAGHLYRYIQDYGIKINYAVGTDASEKFIRVCKAKYPDVRFDCVDILKDAYRFDDII